MVSVSSLSMLQVQRALACSVEKIRILTRIVKGLDDYKQPNYNTDLGLGKISVHYIEKKGDRVVLS